METPELTSSHYWESRSVDLRLNPRLQMDTAGLVDFLESDLGLKSAVVIPTSGSSGAPKYVVLKKEALLHSAASVNRFCAITKEDVWFGGLSTFHVGGLGIFARAFLSQSRIVVPSSVGWDQGRSYCTELREGQVTLTSLTPAHLHDLVEHGEKAPEALRGVFLGGGCIAKELVEKAVALGWPLWPTYGMSEASSQVATSLEGKADWLPILPHWQVEKSERTGRIRLRGEALFSGYVERGRDGWEFRSGRDDEGWFEGQDEVELRDGCLRFSRRSDDLVKVLGELVSVSGIERKLFEAGLKSVIFPLPDSRRENAFAAVVESAAEDKATVLRLLNEALSPLEQLNHIHLVKEFPRTEIGKLDRTAMRALLSASDG